MYAAHARHCGDIINVRVLNRINLKQCLNLTMIYYAMDKARRGVPLNKLMG